MNDVVTVVVRSFLLLVGRFWLRAPVATRSMFGSVTSKKGHCLPPLTCLVVVLFAGCSGPSGPELVDQISLEPDSAFVSPGDTVTFRAIPLSNRGERLDDRVGRVAWEAPSQNLMSSPTEGGSFTVTATALGIGRVFASLGDARQEGTVFVQPPDLDRIEIYVGDEQIGSELTFRIPQGEINARAELVAKLFDTSGNALSETGFRISWLVQLEHVTSILGSGTGVSVPISLGVAGSSDVTLLVGKARKTVRITVVRTVGGS